MKWRCCSCDIPCIVERMSIFPPEVCIYSDRGDYRRSHWCKLERADFQYHRDTGRVEKEKK